MKKIFLYVMLVILSICLYSSLGNLYNYGLAKSFYYQKSLTAKIFFPVAPSGMGELSKKSPFNKNMPEIDPVFQAKYKSFNDYWQKDGRDGFVKYAWPFFLVIAYLMAIFSWFVWLLFKFWALLALAWTFLVWLISGGPSNLITE